MNFLRNKPVIVTIVVVVILIILIAFTGQGTSGTGTVVGEAFVPVQSFFYGVSEKLGGFFDGIVTSGSKQQQKDQLSAELDEYKVKMNSYDELVAENKRLSEMLDYKQNNPTQELIVAKITGKDPGNWFEVFTVDRGKAHGIEKNMMVITPDGLVGRVQEVGLNWSKIMTITDSRSGVAALVERTRDIGVVKGSVATSELDAVLSMNYLPLDTDVIEGDKIVTSGTDGMFTKGFLIGEVKGTSDEAGGKNIVITPSVDFSRLEEVMIVKIVHEEDANNVPAAEDTKSSTSVSSQNPAPQE